MKKNIGIILLIFSILYFYQGFGYLYTYSESGILWLIMIPIIIAYTKIVYGILSLLIGIKFINRKPKNNYLILVLAFLMIIYLIVGIIQYGFSIIYYSGENILLLLLILATSYKLKIEMNITNLIEKIKENKIIIIRILILGFIPYIIAELTTYDFYKFLH